MSSKTVRVLYRLFLRQTRDLERQGVSRLDIRMPLNKEAWLTQQGSHGWQAPRDAFHLTSLQCLAPWAAEGVSSGSLSPSELRQVISRSFRHPPADSSREEQLDRAFLSLRLLGEQIQMQACSSSCSTEGVHVEVTTAHIGGQAELDPTYEPEEGVPPKQYYTYRVRISNCGEETVQVLGRHWVIQDSGGGVIAEVPRGSKGVVGCTPLIKPGECFEYYSGTDLESPGGGSMHGSFQMAVVNMLRPQDKPARLFDAHIAPFKFVPPRSSGGGGDGA